MSVPVSQRSENKLEALVKAEALYGFTVKIKSNKDKFDPIFDEAFGIELLRTARSIPDNVKWANEERVIKTAGGQSYFDNEAWEQRKNFQKKALQTCGRFIVMIETAENVYTETMETRLKREAGETKFKTKKPKINYLHWGKMAADVKKIITNWARADAEKYAREKKK